MTRRLVVALVALGVLALGSSARLFAHEGHDHKVMGTVTMAMADHLMLKDTNGKDVTIQVTKDTRIKAKQATRAEDIKPGTRVVITAVTEKGQMRAKTIEVGVVAATK